MSFIIQGSNVERTIYVGKPEKNIVNVTTDVKSSKKFHYLTSIQNYAKGLDTLFDLFNEYEWCIFDTETGDTSPIFIESPKIVDIDEVDENSIRCNY